VCSDRRRRVEVVADAVPPVSTPCTMTSSMCDPTSVSRAAIYLHLADRAAIDRNVAASRRAGEMELGEQLEQEELVRRRQRPPWAGQVRCVEQRCQPGQQVSGQDLSLETWKLVVKHLKADFSKSC